MPQGQDPERVEAVVEQLVHAILQRLVEIDHHVAAEDHVELVEGPIGGQVVLREDDVLRERAAEPGAIVGSGARAVTEVAVRYRCTR